MNAIENKFGQLLRTKELKFTPERRLILKEVLLMHSHFDVEQLFERLRRKNLQISRATIYRTLPLLVDDKIIKEVPRDQDNYVKYEHIVGHDHHDHLLCIRCGKVYEFKNEQIEKLQEIICRKYKFKQLEHQMGIKGYCRKCQ